MCSSAELILLPITSVVFVMTNTHADYFAILSFKSIENANGYQMSIYFFPIKPYLYGYFLYLLWIIFSLLHQRSFISGAMNCDFRFSTAVNLCHPSSNALLQINLTQRGTAAEFKYITLTCLLCHVWRGTRWQNSFGGPLMLCWWKVGGCSSSVKCKVSVKASMTRYQYWTDL